MTHQALEQAARLAPIIERVHGENHPEMTQVRQLVEELQQSSETTRTAALFAQLRQVTNNFAVPGDACEAVEATYRSLAQADAAQGAAA